MERAACRATRAAPRPSAVQRLLALAGLLAAAAPLGALGKAPTYEINTPKEYLSKWSANVTTDSINPCLVGTILPPDAVTKDQPTGYPPGQDKTWAGGAKSLARYLTLNKDLGPGNALINAMALAVGFPPNYIWVSSSEPMNITSPAYPQGPWQLVVFDSCKGARARKTTAPEAPTVAYWLNRAISVYGVDISQVTYNRLVANYWNITEYTSCVDVYCPASLNFFAGNTTCGCDGAFMGAYAALSPLTPSFFPELKLKQNTSTALCMAGLKQLPLTPAAVRVGLEACFGASTWNTGNGVSWDGTSVNWPLGLTFPEFVLDNAQIRVLQGVRVPMGRYT